jgi:hypothetical protein
MRRVCNDVEFCIINYSCDEAIRVAFGCFDVTQVYLTPHPTTRSPVDLSTRRPRQL